MAKKRDIVSDNRKYGFPVSGRVPERAANKIREEALRSGLSMSKMISLIVSRWADGEDTRVDVDKYMTKVDKLENDLGEKRGVISKLKKQIVKEKKQNKNWESHCASEIDRIHRVFNKSITQLINEIASSKSEQKELAKRINSIFKSNNK